MAIKYFRSFKTIQGGFVIRGELVKLRRLAVIVVLSFISSATIQSSVSFADVNSKTEPKVFEYVSTDQIKQMDLQQVFAITEEFNAQMASYQAMVNRDSIAAIDMNMIAYLSSVQCEECYQALMSLMRNELPFAEEGMSDQKVLIALAEGLGKIGTAKPDSMIEEFEDLYQEAQGRVGTSPMGIDVMKALDEALVEIHKRKYPLVSLNQHIFKNQASAMHSRERLLSMRETLNKKIIGQPEVVQALMDLEWRSALYGKTRERPDAIYLMGLPGTGKDTAAEAFTDAVYGYENAHLKHLFKAPVMKSEADTWKLFGSATGYIGSEIFPPFLAFLVQHSGGKYMLQEVPNHNGKPITSIVDNPDYKGETLPGYYAPETGIVFLNEFHNWAKQLKDDVVKQAIEKGYFTINAPHGGLTEIYVPIRFIIASNEGIGLITSREANGQRHGKALDYNQLLQKWEGVQTNKTALKSEISATNGDRNSGSAGSQRGISEELLSRIPDRYVLLMRPLSPDHLKEIATISMTKLAKNLAAAERILGKVSVTWSPSVIDMIQEYDYEAEANARPVMARLESLVEASIVDAVEQGTLIASDGEMDIHLDVQTNTDQTKSLIIGVTKPDGKKLKIDQPIRYTFKDRPVPPISDQRIDELSHLEEDLKAHVFGIDPILERLASSILDIENETGGMSKPANLVMLTGPSSTGKTEMAKQLAKHLSKDKSEDDLVTFDFSRIQTLHDFKTEILGLTDSLGNPIPSRFMKHYDRNNGKIVVAFDELANVRDKDLLKSLYDFFREPVMHTFSDGVARPMGAVTAIITSNAGQELYNVVPTEAPMQVQMRTWAEIYRRTNNDFELQRTVLERYFPEPLITRIGRNNIFFVPPHNYRSLRQLAQLKFANALKAIAYSENQRGWEVVFPDAEEYKAFIDTAIEEGFALKYQGASIDSYMRDDFQKPIKALLIKNKVPTNARVVIKLRSKSTNQLEDVPGYVTYDLFADGQARPIEFRIKRPHVEKPLVPNKIEQLRTAYHEAGHSIVRTVAFRDAYVSTKITVIPGVDIFGDKWLYYAGVASAQQEKEIPTSREWAIRQIAILAGGETAERLVSRGASHSAGKQNDMERATKVALDAVVKYGLSETWGTHAIPSGTSVEDYVSGLSEKQKVNLEREVQRLVKEGRDFAQQILEANFETALIPLGTELAVKGEMKEADLRAFYAARTLVEPSQTSFMKRGISRLQTQLRKWQNPSRDPIYNELDRSIPIPETLANIDDISKKEQARQFESVPLPDQLPIGTNEAFLNQGSKIQPLLEHVKVECQALLEHAS